MKEWIKSWLNIAPLSADDRLAEAQQAHISDLRVLLDKATERETELAAMIKMVMEERFYKPVITGNPSENRSTPAIAPEHMQDVVVFDEADDTAQVEEQDAHWRELSNLAQEQNEEGIHKVAV